MKKLTLFILGVVFSHSLAFSQGCLPEGITFTTQAQIDNFQTNYPGCTEIEGDVTIHGITITNLNGLSVLASIGGNLSINSSALINLTGLNNTTTIGGSLMFGDPIQGGLNDSLTSLTGLEGLTSIGGGLGIHSTNRLTSLTGLENVTSIDENLFISYNNALASLGGLEGVTSIGGDLIIFANDALSSLTGLENVISIAGSVNLYYINSLTNLSGLTNVTSIGGNIYIADCALASMEGLEKISTIGGALSLVGNNNLSSLSEFDSLTSAGSLEIIGNPLLNSLSGLNNVTSIAGNIFINSNQSLTSLNGLENINAGSIAGLNITTNSSLSTCEVQSICGYLASPNGTVDISNNAPGCNSSEEVEAACEQHCLPEGITFTTQEQIDNFQTNYPGCTEIEGDVIIHGDNIENLNGLIALTSIGGNTYIEDDESLTSLNGLNNLAFIGGDLNLTVGNLINFTGLEGLTYIGGNFEIRDDFVLINLTGLDNLASIGGYLSIGPRVLGGSGPPTIIPNTTLTSLTGLNSLTTIGGDLTIYGNDALTNLVALENLTSIGGDLKIGISNYADLISGNSSLTGLIGLENVDASSINNITIVDNSSLTKCEVQSICNYLVSPYGIIEIYDNAPGCSSPEEVKAACTFSVEPVGLDNEIFIYPNPACKTVTISGNNAKAIREILIYNQTGQRILQSKSINNPLDISKLRPGVYIVQLVTNQGIVREKVTIQ